MKAELIAAIKDKYNSYITYLIYNYRGREYMITAYNNGYSESLSSQHRYEQQQIDRELEKQNQPEAYTGEVEKALDMLYDIWEQQKRALIQVQNT